MHTQNSKVNVINFDLQFIALRQRAKERNHEKRNEIEIFRPNKRNKNYKKNQIQGIHTNVIVSHECSHCYSTKFRSMGIHSHEESMEHTMLCDSIQ